MIAGVFEIPGSLLAWFYEFTSNYAIAIALIAVVVMVLITPLTLKSTKGMLEMQRLAPETQAAAEPVPQRPGQAQRRDDEALPGAQGQPDGLVPAVARPDAGVHHHVPGAARPDLPADRRGHRAGRPRRVRRVGMPDHADRLPPPLHLARVRACSSR